MDRLYEADGYRYTPWSHGRVHQVDYNGDGRGDLVFWNEDRFEVHLQNKRGLFAPVAKTFTTDVTFDSDELASLAAPHGVRRRRKDHQPAGDMTGKVLHSLTDMNGDGVTDLEVFSLKGGSPWKMHFTYEVHPGTQSPDGGTVFAADFATRVQSDGIPFGMEQHDFNHDGQVDMMFTTFGPGVVEAAGMLIAFYFTRSVPEDLDFYRMDGGIYPDKPSATRKINVRPSDSGKKNDIRRC